MIAIGSDHGGVELKDYLVGFLRCRGADVRDFGTQGRESVDYPDFGREVSLRVARGEADRDDVGLDRGIGSQGSTQYVALPTLPGRGLVQPQHVRHVEVIAREQSRVAIADGQLLVRGAVTALLDAEDDVAVAGAAADSEEALAVTELEHQNTVAELVSGRGRRAAG